MSKAFASQADLADKKITFEQLSAHCWAYTAEGDPNSGVIIGDKFIMVSDCTATPSMARDLIARIREAAGPMTAPFEIKQDPRTSASRSIPPTQPATRFSSAMLKGESGNPQMPPITWRTMSPGMQSVTIRQRSPSAPLLSSRETPIRRSP